MTRDAQVPQGSDRQRIHYESIHADYEAHYYDDYSMAYREKFYYQPMFQGIDLSGKVVADLACGSGHNSLAMLRRFPGVRTVGFDISAPACASYRELVGQDAFQVDLTKVYKHSTSFDAVIVVGGLHHCVSDLDTTLENVAAMLKPDGAFIMVEPNREYLLQLVRDAWYVLDRYFDHETEAALSHDDLLLKAGQHFQLLDVRYLGGPGYFVILNSLLFRLPYKLKRLISNPLLWLDTLYNRLPGRRLYPYFVARWKRANTLVRSTL